MVYLEGGAKDKFIELAGFYELQCSFVNGHHYWTSISRVNSIWFDSTDNVWRLATSECLGKYVSSIKGPVGHTEYPQHIFRGWKWTKDGLWIDANNCEIRMIDFSAGNYSNKDFKSH